MRKIVAVASGKGGVGKSTVAANLAVALANHVNTEGRPLKVALVDVDFYGPSIPTLMGGGGVSQDNEGKLIPAMKYNVKFISIAFFLKSFDDPIIWRGPMFGKAMAQLFDDVAWGEVDVCIVDMPPGTGDAQLSLSQIAPLDGVVMVTTPQEVALSDVRRAVNMFGKVNVPVLGVIENMAGFVTPSGERIDIFGSGGGETLATQYNLRYFGSLPIDVSVREGGDKGVPAAVDANSTAGKQFVQMAQQLWTVLTTEQEVPRLQVVN